MAQRRNPTRRVFLQTAGSVAATAAATTWARPAWAGAAGANEKVVMGIIGPGGQGSGLLGSFVKLPGVEFAWVWLT